MSQRYVAARRAQRTIRDILEKKEQMTGLIKARKYQFVNDPDTERLLRSSMGLGTLDVAGEFGALRRNGNFRDRSGVTPPDPTGREWSAEQTTLNRQSPYVYALHNPHHLTSLSV
ncbi:hypothetical protein MAR_026395 [Mya arenaria]|uniref:Uncharacterized protein n=1 Tax=Mya arenaria TaxID=6604 RepID=A0ABY7EQE0_MYAAR|nr:hypothetical protein MAR_026395 [Mya arenaria]